MKHILFLNIWEGLGFMLNKKLVEEGIEIEYLNLKEHSEDFKKHTIKSTPVLIILDNEKESDRLNSTEEILKYLKDVQNTKIPLGNEEQSLLVE